MRKISFCLFTLPDYINEVLNETNDDENQNIPEDWEEGLTFTARSSRKYHTNEFVHFSNVRSSISCLKKNCNLKYV